ncbi:unnamed protein product [Leptidea sinapis]|uniref:non-specific serine/threonine protein kinase n=1 Tax=Leptidea sinapis TaxID=189913 RepID=A0A5E4QGT9_9NEOP|nr:unnamed protein product [Leptidea sinapis]
MSNFEFQGEKYDGRRADVWSCGVILYALLVGALPFDDDNLRQLLEKVKRGVFHVPHFVPPDCQQLLRGMIEVNPEKRMTLAEITRHQWVTAGGRGELEQELPMMEVVQTRVLPSADAIDPDVLQAISSLGCFKHREKLIQDLLSSHHNTEKVIYFLLLERKRRRPARDDEPRPPALAAPSDPPRKRLDTCRVNGQSAHFGQISEGSPITPRRSQFRSYATPSVFIRWKSSHSRISARYTLFLSSPSVREHHHQRANSTGPTISLNIIGTAGTPAAPWRTRLATIKNSFLGSPRFHRRKMQASSEEVHLTPESSPELTKRSWFGSLLLSVDKEETFTALVKGKPLATVKADLIHAFLSVDISTITKAPGENGKEYLYAITFTLLSGNIRRFRRVCEVLQSAVCRAPGASRRNNHLHYANEMPDSPENPQKQEHDCDSCDPGNTPSSNTSNERLDQNGSHTLGSNSSVASGSSGYKQSVRSRRAAEPASTSLDHEIMSCGRDLPECRDSTSSPRRGLESRDASIKDELRRNNSLRENRREPRTEITPTSLA